MTLSWLRDRARGGRGRLVAAVAAACAGALAWAATGGELGGAALRALGAVTLLGVLAVAVRRRAPALAAGPLRVEARQPLGRDSGVALVEADEEPPAGVALLADLGAASGEPR